MSTVNAMVSGIQTQVREKITQTVTKNKSQYQELVKNLILQGLIKLMEAQIFLKIRKSDKSIVEAAIPQAVKEYKQMMAAEVKVFKGQEPPCNVVINEKDFLPEYDTSSDKSC